MTERHNRTFSVLLVLTAAGCAGHQYQPHRFPPRPHPAELTAEAEAALCRAGYVSLGFLEASVAAGAAANSASELQRQAAAHGGDLVRIVNREVPTRQTVTQSDCRYTASDVYFFPSSTLVETDIATMPRHGSTDAYYDHGRTRLEIDISKPTCIADSPTIVGTRSVNVSKGELWRKEPDLAPNQCLALAVRDGDEGLVRTTLKNVRDVDLYFVDPPLVVAANGGNRLIVRQLLDAGAKAGRETALLAAVRHGDVPVAQTLLALGASTAARQPDNGDGPLHVAVHKGGSTEMLKVLLDAGANPNAQNVIGQTPLQSAISICDLSAAKILISAGADPWYAKWDEDALRLAREACPGKSDQLRALLSEKPTRR